jgi:hypothetical protein
MGRAVEGTDFDGTRPLAGTARRSLVLEVRSVRSRVRGSTS